MFVHGSGGSSKHDHDDGYDDDDDNVPMFNVARSGATIKQDCLSASNNSRTAALAAAVVAFIGRMPRMNE